MHVFVCAVGLQVREAAATEGKAGLGRNCVTWGGWRRSALTELPKWLLYHLSLALKLYEKFEL